MNGGCGHVRGSRFARRAGGSMEASTPVIFALTCFVSDLFRAAGGEGVGKTGCDVKMGRLHAGLAVGCIQDEYPVFCIIILPWTLQKPT